MDIFGGSDEGDVGDATVGRPRVDDRRSSTRTRRKAFERKPTSGGMMMIIGTVVKHWSRTQASRSFSVAASEYHASVTGKAEGLDTQSWLFDLGLKAEV